MISENLTRRLCQKSSTLKKRLKNPVSNTGDVLGIERKTNNYQLHKKISTFRLPKDSAILLILHYQYFTLIV